MTKIAIIGNGLSGRLAALYLDKHLPGAELTMIDPDVPNKPIVGESTIEMTSQFFLSLGLGTYLEENQRHKYGLTYYFPRPAMDGDMEAPGAAGAMAEKGAMAETEAAAEASPAAGAGDGPDYILHEAPGVIRLPAYNLNRFTFDDELARRVAPLVRKVTGKVTEVEISDEAGGRQTIHVMDKAGKTSTVTADHVIDCSGRARLLAKQMGLEQDPPFQRSSYWFRLAGFDRSILNGLNVDKPRHHCYDSYSVTHHFYGKGYWIWIIPMQGEDGEDLASVGVTYRPEILGEKAMNQDKMLDLLSRDHPRVRALIETGRKVDEARYYNYMYEARQYYDTRGRWFLLGDSGFTFDPAGSLGIAYLGHQIPQITSMILKAGQGMLTPAYVEAMEGHVQAELYKQDQLSQRYPVMDDPIKLSWTLVFNYMAYFHLFLPDYMTGAFLNGGVARRTMKLLMRKPAEMIPVAYAFPQIMDKLSERAKEKGNGAEIIATAAHFHKAVPFNFYRGDNLKRGRVAAAYLYKRGLLRAKALRLLHWWREPSLWPMVAGQYLRTGGEWLLALLLVLRPRIYERPASKDPAMMSAFDPQYSFLFPEEAASRARPGMGRPDGGTADRKPARAKDEAGQMPAGVTATTGNA